MQLNNINEVIINNLDKIDSQVETHIKNVEHVIINNCNFINNSNENYKGGALYLFNIEKIISI
jgi:hypothetical protein